MNKVEGYVLYDEKNGVNYRRVYMNKASANIAITERYEKADIDTGRIKILPIAIVSYVDLRTDIKVKDKCPNCGGLGTVNEKKVVPIVKKEETKKSKKKSKKQEVKEEKVEQANVVIEKVVCPTCKGTKEVWKETKAIVIF